MRDVEIIHPLVISRIRILIPVCPSQEYPCIKIPVSTYVVLR
jgi:hypothetical protein